MESAYELQCLQWKPIVVMSMMPSSNGNIFHITGPLWGESTGPLTKANDAEFRCFLWLAPEQTFEHAIGTLVIWDAIALIMTSLQWCQRCRHCDKGGCRRNGTEVVTITPVPQVTTEFSLWQLSVSFEKLWLWVTISIPTVSTCAHFNSVTMGISTESIDKHATVVLTESPDFPVETRNSSISVNTPVPGDNESTLLEEKTNETRTTIDPSLTTGKIYMITLHWKRSQY